MARVSFAFNIPVSDSFLLVGCCFISSRIRVVFFWNKAPWQWILHHILLVMKLSIRVCAQEPRFWRKPFYTDQD